MTKYLVEGASESGVDVPATAVDGGEEVTGRLPVVVVDLINQELGGRMTYFEAIPTEAERDAALAKYVRGAVMDVTIAIAPAPPAAPPPVSPPPGA